MPAGQLSVRTMASCYICCAHSRVHSTFRTCFWNYYYYHLYSHQSSGTSSGVARVLRAPVQRHVMGPLVTKQLSNSFAARTAVVRPVNRFWRLRAQTTFLVSGYKHRDAKCCNPQFCPPPKKKWASMFFQWEYALLNVWLIISQQQCEIELWFQRTTYRARQEKVIP